MPWSCTGDTWTLAQEAVLARGAASLQSALENACASNKRRLTTTSLGGARVVCAAVTPSELSGWLGPKLAEMMEGQWGDLREYRGIASQVVPVQLATK